MVVKNSAFLDEAVQSGGIYQLFGEPTASVFPVQKRNPTSRGQNLCVSGHRGKKLAVN